MDTAVSTGHFNQATIKTEFKTKGKAEILPKNGCAVGAFVVSCGE